MGVKTSPFPIFVVSDPQTFDKFVEQIRRAKNEGKTLASALKQFGRTHRVLSRFRGLHHLKMIDEDRYNKVKLKEFVLCQKLGTACSLSKYVLVCSTFCLLQMVADWFKEKTSLEQLSKACGSCVTSEQMHAAKASGQVLF